VPKLPRCHDFPMNPSDFLNDANVIVMTSEQVGVYAKLLLQGWLLDEPGIYPAQDEALQRLARATPEEWSRSKAAIARCFDVSDGRWIQKRQRQEWIAQTRRIERASTAGKLGNEVRWSQRDKSDRDTPSDRNRSPIGVPPSSLPPTSQVKDKDSDAFSLRENLSPAAVVKSLARGKGLPHPTYDPRIRLWETAKANALPGTSPDKLMAVLSWLWFTKGIQEWPVIEICARTIPRAENAYALLVPGGKALEAFIGEAAVARAEGEKLANQRADEAMGIARRG
jgi:uncharacterized protein YdaU (DUF1376 family)